MYATPAVVGAVAYTLLQLGHADLLFPDWVLLVVPFALTLSLRAAAWTYRRVRAARALPPPPPPVCAGRGRDGSEPPIRAPQVSAAALGAQAAERLLLLLLEGRLRDQNKERQDWRVRRCPSPATLSGCPLLRSRPPDVCPPRAPQARGRNAQAVASKGEEGEVPPKCQEATSWTRAETARGTHHGRMIDGVVRLVRVSESERPVAWACLSLSPCVPSPVACRVCAHTQCVRVLTRSLLSLSKG